MEIKKQEIWKRSHLIFNKLPNPGVLLVSGDSKNDKNIMTIGWMQIGIIWKDPVVSFLVRPSRYSYKLLQEYDDFTINILSDNFNKDIAFCGAKSGAYCDKFKETGLKSVPSKKVSALSLKDADIILECKKIYKNNIEPENLSDLILARYYSNGDIHQIITGIILNFKSKI